MKNKIKEKIKYLSKYTGVSNVIQTVGEREILLLPCKGNDQQNDLLKKYLPSNFKGMIVSPFPLSSTYDHTLLPLGEIKELETELINYFYPLEKEVAFFGVTGTNGKTSVAWLISEILRCNGINALYMGTPGVFLAGKKQDREVLTTTPSYLDIRKALYYYGQKIEAISLELSSHALEQGRLKDLKFDVVAWTNFSQDHLDFHKTMENYFEAKAKILDVSKEKKIIVPKEQSSLVAKLKDRAMVVETSLEGSYPVPKVFEKGFARENFAVALEMAKTVFSLKTPMNMKGIVAPPGRMQVLEKEKAVFVVDYAHTPDAIEKAIRQLREIYRDYKVCTVFGCGGDRDKSKRPLMGKAASAFSDSIIITSDNPRTEDPMDIINDIIPGVVSDYEVEVDRRKAIEKSYENVLGKTVILIAGKGHENYQDINGVRHAFDDCEIVRKLG